MTSFFEVRAFYDVFLPKVTGLRTYSALLFGTVCAR